MTTANISLRGSVTVSGSVRHYHGGRHGGAQADVVLE